MNRRKFLGTTAAALWSIRDDRFPRSVRAAAQPEPTPLPAPPREGAPRSGS